MTDKTIPITLPASTWAQVLHALDASPIRGNYLVRAAREHIRETIKPNERQR